MSDKTTDTSNDDRRRLVKAIERELDRLEQEWEAMQQMWTVDPDTVQRLATRIESVRAQLAAMRDNPTESEQSQ